MIPTVDVVIQDSGIYIFLCIRNVAGGLLYLRNAVLWKKVHHCKMHFAAAAAAGVSVRLCVRRTHSPVIKRP